VTNGRPWWSYWKRSLLGSGASVFARMRTINALPLLKDGNYTKQYGKRYFLFCPPRSYKASELVWRKKGERESIYIYMCVCVCGGGAG
jgi:hypothetical protein